MWRVAGQLSGGGSPGLALRRDGNGAALTPRDMLNVLALQPARDGRGPAWSTNNRSDMFTRLATIELSASCRPP